MIALFKAYKSNLVIIFSLYFIAHPLKPSYVIDPVLRQTTMAHIYTKTQFQEGLIGTTRIKTVDGYKSISDLSIGCLICVPNSDIQQKIILIEKQSIPYFYEIQTTDFTIHAAPAQKIYDAHQNKWIEIQNLTEHCFLGHQSITSVQKINWHVQIYKIHTSQHIFEIEHDIIGHNFDVAATCDIGLTIGQLVVRHPVLVMIGRTISLIKLAIQVHQRFQDVNQQTQQLLDALLDEDVVIETRNYYESRRKQLSDLLTQYHAMKNVAQVVLNQSTLGTSLLSNIISSQSRIVLLPALQSELQYSPIEKQNLLIARQQDLEALEKEIINIQLTLAIYFDEILSKHDELLTHIDELAYEADCITMLWDPEHEEHYSLHDLLYMSIKNITYLDMYVTQLEKTIQDLSIYITLHEQEPKTIVLHQTSNILSVCTQARQTVTQTKKYLDQLKRSICIYQQMNQEMLQNYPIIHQSTFTDLTLQAQQQLNEKDQQHKANIIIKQSQIQFPTPPNDPEPDDDKNKKEFDRETYDYNQLDFGDNKDDNHHMFGQQLERKLKDTQENRQQVRSMVRNKNNCCGQDNFGVVSFVQVESDGSQLWAEVNPLTHRIRNCGINKPGQHRSWNPETGLKQRSYKNK